jgi:bacillithiol system protein YtxJ
MNWITLDTLEQLEDINALSFNKPQILFKHSTTCSISLMAKNRLDKGDIADNAAIYYLDLLQYRPISNAIAAKYNVIHQSPQVLVIKNGECVYEETHNGITLDELEEQLLPA